MVRGSTASEYLDRALGSLDPRPRHLQHHHGRTVQSQSQSCSRRDVSKDKDESYGYLFNGLALLLPVLRSRPVGQQGVGNEDETGVGAGLVIATRRKKDKKGKGKMMDESPKECSGGKGLRGDDMVVLVSRGRARSDETLMRYDLLFFDRLHRFCLACLDLPSSLSLSRRRSDLDMKRSDPFSPCFDQNFNLGMTSHSSHNRLPP